MEILKAPKLTLSHIFQLLIQQNFAIAVYQLPNSRNVHLIADQEIKWINEHPEIEKTEGFIMAPFITTEANQSFLIAPQIHVIFSKNRTEIVQNQSFFDFNISTKENIKWYVNEGTTQNHTTSKEDFIASVNYAKSIMVNDLLKKVVLSHTKSIELPSKYYPLKFFKKLCIHYANSFVSLVSTPENGTWIGATPEVLMQVDEHNVFRTVALAGTKMNESQNDIAQTNWTQKEIEEQALVSRYILNCFKKIRLREYEDIGPKTISQGNLLHLKTDYSVNINDLNYTNLASTLLELLHPTSAVCGMPKEEALAVIKANEKHDRKYYAGFVGPVNIPTIGHEKRTDIFVNLRCMQLFDHKAILYAGAGITPESNAEAEYIEIENKFNVLLDVLNKM